MCWKRRLTTAALATLAAGVCLWTFLPAFGPRDAHGGEVPSQIVARANRLYGEGKYEKAELLYRDAQKSLPESPEINFNLGNVAYRKGDYDRAEEYYGKVAESPNARRELRKKALYNLGNCAFRRGEKLLDSDLQRALDSLKLSILRYHDVIARDERDREAGRGEAVKGDEDAKYNIEVARLRIKDILDKLKQQEEKRKEQQKQQEEFIKKLQKAIEEQAKIVEETGEARQRKEQGEDVSAAVEDLTKQQTENKKRTNELSEELQQQIEAAKKQGEGGQQQPAPDENVLSARNSLREGEIEQGTALEHLDRQGLAEAKTNEENALRSLQDALEKLAKPQSPQPQPGGEKQPNEGDQNEQQEKEEKQSGDEGKKGEDDKKMTSREAQEELAKLRKQASDARKRNLQNFLRRHPGYRQQREEYEPVDRDW